MSSSFLKHKLYFILIQISYSLQHKILLVPCMADESNYRVHFAIVSLNFLLMIFHLMNWSSLSKNDVRFLNPMHESWLQLWKNFSFVVNHLLFLLVSISFIRSFFCSRMRQNEVSLFSFVFSIFRFVCSLHTWIDSFKRFLFLSPFLSIFLLFLCVFRQTWIHYLTWFVSLGESSATKLSTNCWNWVWRNTENAEERGNAINVKTSK